MALLADYPELDVDKVRALIAKSQIRRRKPEPLQPRSYADLTGAVAAGWMTKNEARKLAGLIQRRGPVHKPPAEAAQ